MNKDLKVTLYSLGDTQKLAQYVADLVGVGDVILLDGNLGSGKTTFVQKMSENIGVKDDVQSPTFSIVNVYEAKDHKKIWHYDLYRLKHPEELQELAFDEAFSSGLTLIEWPDIIETIVPDNYLKISFEFAKDERRDIRMILSGRFEQEYMAIKDFIKENFNDRA